jgi:carboxypeptidase T
MRKLLFTACLVALCGAGNLWAYTFQSTGLYHSYNDLAAWAANLQAQNPNLVNVVQYGTTASGRPLLALDITVNPLVNDPNKPEFLFAAGIHAREVITSESARTLAETLVNGYRSADPLYVSMLSKRDVWIIPDQNPDGRMRVEAGYSDQRKNFHWYSGQNTNDATCGVDLNRNYPHKWSLASSSLKDETYRGPSPLSEAESSSLWNLLHDQDRFSHLVAAIDFHSGAATILTPWTSQTDYNQNPLPAADRQKFDFLATRMQQITGYSTSRLGYDSWGTLTDSLYEEFHTYAVTEEVFGGPFYDYFTYFNPIDQPTRDATINKAVGSAMFMLSDEAFAVPEPSTFVLLVVAGMGALVCIWRRRRG